MTPQIARLYAHVLPIFWPYLWLQLRAIFKRQDVELRTLLIAVTKWGRIHIVSVGDHWRAYKKPALVKAHWSDPAWESALPPNLVGAPLEFSCRFWDASNTPPPEAHPERSRRISGLTPDTS
jgi:hypothetical protein